MRQIKKQMWRALTVSVALVFAGCAKKSIMTGAPVTGSEDVILIPMQDAGGKWGYVDAAKTWVIRPQFADAWLFRRGLGVVVERQRYGVINTKGEWIIKPDYDFATVLIDRADPEQWFVFLDRKRHHYVVNRSGQTIVNATGALNQFLDFSEGLALVRAENQLLGFKDARGRWRIPPQYEFGGNFADGLASVSDGKTRWFINSDNQKVLVLPREIDYANDFGDGLAPARKNHKYGYIDKQGKVVIDFLFDDARSFAEGLAQVTHSGTTKYINTRGETVFSVTPYDFALSFAGGYAEVFHNQKCGLVNRRGELVLPVEYDQIHIYDKHDRGYLRVTNSGKDYYIDIKTGVAFK